MKNSTDFTRDILKNKEHQKISPCDIFIPYLVQKYISGVSPEHCMLVNSILNNKLRVWKDEQEIYDFLKLIIPKKNNTYFKYFSPSKKVKDSEIKGDLDYLSQTMEISKRELREMIVYFPILADKLVENKEKILHVKK
jgi:hypothetical protein